MFEKYLTSVIKPGRYIGGELNSVVKDHNSVDVRIVLSYPDLYEIGMSNYGMRILYNIINKRDDALCERVFAVWKDAEGILRKHNIPLFSLETKTPLNKFDIVAFSLEYELTYTNMINMLDLANIPIYSQMRKEEDPIVIAGGTATYNPLPVADFLDAVVIGEGEDVIGEIIDMFKKLKRKKARRKEILEGLQNIPGVFVPMLNSSKNSVIKRYVTQLKKENYPLSPVVPYIAITHDRLTVEIMRGCTQGCRFCQEGFVSRPRRELPINDVVSIAAAGIKKTGWEEVSLLSLSASDHTMINLLIDALKSKLPNTTISLPSLRGDAITEDFAQVLKNVKRTSITLAAEAGTERLRRVINKNITDDALLNSCEVAVKNGWQKIKLYFMIGLPQETSMDIEAITELVRRLARVSGNAVLKISISPFVPKPHTPFQRFAQDSLELMKEKERYLRDKLNKRRIELSWRRPEVSFLEAVFSRGTEVLSKVIENAWRMGSRFEEWSEEFNFDIWEEAFNKSGIDPFSFTNKWEDRELPWDFIDTGLREEFLLEEAEKSLKEEVSPDCMETTCYNCGVCDAEALSFYRKRRIKDVGELVPHFGRRKKKNVIIPTLSKKRIRVMFSKTGSLKFISHLDTIRVITRAIRRSGIKIAYTKGFRKRPKIAFGPPLPLGVSGEKEYFDLFFEVPFAGDVVSIMNKVLPEGIKILDAKPVFIKDPSISKIVSLLKYRISPLQVDRKMVEKIMRSEHILVTRQRGNDNIEIDIRPYIHSLVNGDDHVDVLVRFLPEGSIRIEELFSLLGIEKGEVLTVDRVGIYAEQEGELVELLKTEKSL